MNSIQWGLNSYGTIYGTLRDYDADGNDVGPKNITGWGIFFTVRTKWSYLPDSSIIFKKSVGNGITISNGTQGAFDVAIQSANVNYNPTEYVYEVAVNESGTSFSDGTTQLKSVGSGIFQILKGAKYGTT